MFKLLLILLLSLSPIVHAQQPILQIDTGGHQALIHDIAFTPDGKYLVSAGDDKTIRVWDWQTATTERIIRGQIDEGNEGKIYAMALSPDGRWLAVGGWMHPECAGRCGDIRLYHFPTGQLTALLKGHSNVVDALAFAPNNRYLISGSKDDTAMIWDINSQQRLHTLRGHRDDIYAVAFTPDSQRVVTGSDDHDLRLWQVNNAQPIALLSGHEGDIGAVAVSPDGTIASGSYDYTIRLWDGKTGRFIKQLANQGTQIGSLSFSPNGKVLLSGVASNVPIPYHCHIYAIPSGKQLLEYREHDNVVIATAISPDGRLAATGGGAYQEINIWDIKTGETKQRLQGVGARTWAVGLTDDWLAWGNTWTQDSPITRGDLAYQLNLSSPNKTIAKPQAINPQTAFKRATTQWQNYALQRQKGGNYGYYAILNIQHNNQTVASIEHQSWDGYGHWSYTFTPNGKQIISGGASGVLTAYNKQGQKLGDYVGHTGVIWAVAVSPDGQLLASGSIDQTVRLWNVKTFENILTLFRGTDNEWVIWTPQGYYAASVNGDDMIGWHINKGVAKNPNYVTANQVHKHFHRPDIIAEAIRLRSAKQAVAQARNTDFDIKQLATMQPPAFTVLQPQHQSQTHKQYIRLELQLAANKQGLHNIEVYVNGVLAGNPRFGKASLPTSGLRKSLHIGLQQGENHIEVVANNAVGETRRTLTVHLKRDGALDKKGDLYLLAIGVSQYRDERLTLQYADNDARDLYQQLKRLGKSKYNKIHATLLTDGAKPPTADNIRDALDTLYNAKANDTTIIFVAGHGENADNGYYFLSQDATQRNGRWRSSTVVRWLDFQDIIQNTKGKRLLLLDTCHSGAAIQPSLLKEIVDDRIYVMAATDYQTLAEERDELQHGIFAYSLLEGLKGKADAHPDLSDNKIQLQELATYVSGKVRQLTNDMQQPVLHIPNGFKDFELVRLD